MGFFSKVGRALKGVIRNKIVQGALNTATGGLSGRILQVAKQVGAVVRGNTVAKKQNRATQAMLEKMEKVTVPNVRDPIDVQASSKRRAKKTKAGKRGPTMFDGLSENALLDIWREFSTRGTINDTPLVNKQQTEHQLKNALIDKMGARAYALWGGSPKKQPKGKAPKAKANGKKKNVPKKQGGAKRKAPPGGLDLARIAQMWRAEGKPGTWQSFIKSHSDIRKG
jgi:hypothetical protein